MSLKELPVLPNLSLLLRDRALRIPDTPVISFCYADNIVEYNSKSLDTITDLTASYYASFLPPPPSDPNASSVIAVIGVNSIEYITTFFALQRLGHSPLLLSTRLAHGQIAHVMAETKCKAVIFGESYREVMQQAQETLSQVALIDMASLESLNCDSRTSAEQNQNRVADSEAASKRPAWILHSSGSTGLPKPISYSHCPFQYSKKFALDMEMESSYFGLTTLPLFHAFGMWILLFALQMGVKIVFLDSSVPITGPQIIDAVTRSEAKILYSVPYVLRLIADSPGGVDVLRACKAVAVAGAPFPQDHGDELVQKGVVICNIFGTTELGVVMRSNSISAELWNWLVFDPSASRPGELFFEPRDNGLWELCAGKEYRLFAGEEARDKDGIYRTRDLWEQHPQYPNLYRHSTRLDDLLILENGENANPIPLEIAARTAPGVDNAIAFGAGKAYLGMFILPTNRENGVRRSAEDVLGEVWKRIELVNREVPAFARIAKDAIVIKTEEEGNWPKTEKGNVIRAQFYKKFGADIDAFYRRAEESNAEKTKPATLEDLKMRVKKGAAEILEIALGDLDEDADLFTMGVDSLGAISVRRKLIKQIDFGDAKISENVVYEHPTVRKLAEYLWSLLADNDGESKHSMVEDINSLIEKFSKIPPPSPSTAATTERHHKNENHILLTGVTGHLGSHILRYLLSLPHVTHITCLVRAKSRTHALSRVFSSPAFINRSIPSSIKLTALQCDLTDELLGLSQADYTRVAQNVTHVIHAAWSVNFNLSVTSFSPDLLGLNHLLRLSSGRKSPPQFTFISSISVGFVPSLPAIPESTLPLEQDALLPSLGYAQSKSVAEHILSRVSEQNGMRVDVVRAGQLVGDTERGMWNEKEAWPAMMSTALSLGVLPEKVDEAEVGLKWLPVDMAARATVDIAGLGRDSKANGASGDERRGMTVYNLVHPTTTSWEGTVVPGLRKAGLVFETVEGHEWTRRLKEGKDDGKVLGQAGKLVAYYEAQFSQADASEAAPVKINMSNALKYASVLRDVHIDEDMIQKCVEYWMSGPWGELGSERCGTAGQ